MTFNNNLQTTEPAFLSHEKYVRQRPRGYHKNLTYFCYSLSNLALIVACILALVFSVKFLQDDPLYEYGEYLLTLKFYRYIIYIIVILPLTLLVPLFNAASACFLSGSSKRREPPAAGGSSVLGVKMFYQILMAILILIGLIFIAPSIRQSSVTSQMQDEFRRHMLWRYDSDFSYEFLDRLQSEYECCDEVWYRNNFHSDTLPLSCYHSDGTYSNFHRRTCPEVLGSMVSTRCAIIAASLVAILLALAILIGLDTSELMKAGGSRHYDIREHETNAMRQQDESGGSLTSRRNSHDDGQSGAAATDRAVEVGEHDQLVQELSNRLRMREREREIPLLPKNGSSGITTNLGRGSASRQVVVNQTRRSPSSFSDDENSESNAGDVSSTGTSQAAILTRANYRQYNNRPKSPVFIGTPDSGSGSMSLNEPAPSTSGLGGGGLSYHRGQPKSNTGGTSPKSVLKKTSSFQKIDSDLDDIDNDDEVNHVQRDAQTRRSLLNVRFAE